MAKLKVITPKKVQRARAKKRRQTIILFIVTAIFVIVISSVLIYLITYEQNRQFTCRQYAAELSRVC